MEYILDWAHRVTAYLIFTSVLTNLIRKQNYYKYIRLVMGVILIFLVVKPVFVVLKRDGEYRFHLSRYLLTEEASDAMFLDKISDVRDELLFRELEAGLSSRIREMAEDRGFEVRKIEFTFGTGESAYGIPEAVYLELVSENNMTESFGLEPPEIIRLKEELVDEFSFYKKNVTIVLLE